MGNSFGHEALRTDVVLDEFRIFTDFTRENPEAGEEFSHHTAHLAQYIYFWSIQQVDENAIDPWVIIFILHLLTDRSSL